MTRKSPTQSFAYCNQSVRHPGNCPYWAHIKAQLNPCTSDQSHSHWTSWYIHGQQVWQNPKNPKNPYLRVLEWIPVSHASGHLTLDYPNGDPTCPSQRPKFQSTVLYLSHKFPLSFDQHVLSGQEDCLPRHHSTRASSFESAKPEGGWPQVWADEDQESPPRGHTSCLHESCSSGA